MITPVVLTSYQDDLSSADPYLHAWDGRKWVHIANDKFAAAQFLKLTPNRAIVLGDKPTLTDRIVSDIRGWCPTVKVIDELQMDHIVNELGKSFKFEDQQWSRYAKNYDLELKDLNASRRNHSWYDQGYVRNEQKPKRQRKVERFKQTRQQEIDVVEEVEIEVDGGWQEEAIVE